MPNPIKVLKEWMRVIGPGGLILCGVPDKRFTFDHRRPRTTLKHLINDFEHQENGQSEHAIEFVLNWDADMDRFCSYQEFKRNLLENPLVYTHFHCWSRDDICQLFDYVGLDIAYSTLIGDTAYIIGRKGPIEREISV
jgi:predicted SAM-dependent methyltransferase